MTASRIEGLLLALAAVALSAVTLASAAPARADAIDPLCVPVPLPGCPSYDPCTLTPAMPGCPGFPIPIIKTFTLTVTPPTSGTVSAPAQVGFPPVPAISCTSAGGAGCTSVSTLVCPTGEGSCPAPATVVLTATGGPPGATPQWSSNCPPTTASSCTLTLNADKTVALTWFPAAPATTAGDPADQDQPQQPQQQQQQVIAPAKASCKVPKLKGKTLAAARKALKRANCALGKVKKKTVKHGKAGRVVAQGVTAGATKPNGTKVALTLSRRRA